MIEKSEVLEILQDIVSNLNYDNWEKAKKDTDTYIKNLEITTNEKINQLVPIYNDYQNRYGEYDRKTVKIRKKLDKEINSIFTKNN